jgi:hypothetical protein
MTRTFCWTVTFVGMLGSAIADDGGKLASDSYFSCNYHATKRLIEKKRSAHVPADVLAREALEMCATEADALARELGWRAMFRVRGEMERTNKSIVEADRRGTFWAPNPQAAGTEQEFVPGCAAGPGLCGMRPEWDDRLRIWRPYPRAQ